MKKSLISILLALSFVTGCGKAAEIDEILAEPVEEVVESTAQESVEEPVEEQTEEEEVVDLYSRPELNAYYKVLTDRLAEDPDGFGADLIYIDEDDSYELAILDGEAHADGAYLYTCVDGKAVSLESEGFPFYGADGSFSYGQKQNLFCYDDALSNPDGGHFMFFAFSIKDGQAVPYCSLSREWLYEDRTKDVFENFGETVTEAEYEDLYNKYWCDICLDLTTVYYGNCDNLASEEDIDAFLKDHVEDPDTTPYTEEELSKMTPEELFKAFCDNRAQAECFSDEPGGESYYIDASQFDFNNVADATEMVDILDPADIDNDGEVEFILANPVYGDYIFDCKDGKITCFTHGWGTAGICQYVTYKDAVWVLHKDTTHTGRRSYHFDKYDGDLNIVDTFRLYWTADDAEEKNKVFHYNDEVITEEQFNAYYNEIFG